jgi:WD40 repeat protein
VVTSGDDSLIKIWSLDKDGILSFVRTLTGHTDWVYQTIELKDASDRLASISKDGTLRVWVISTGRLVRSITLGFEGRALANYPDDNFNVISGDVDGRVLLWNLNDGTNTVLALLRSKINDIWLLNNNTQLGIATSNNCGTNCGTVPYYDQGSTWILNVADITSSRFQYNEPTTYTKLYFVFGATFLANTLDLGNYGAVGVHTNSVKRLDVLSQYPDLFVSGSDDSTVRLWKLSTKSLVYTYTCHTNGIKYALDNYKIANSNESILFTGALDGLVNAYQIPTSNKLLAAYQIGNNWNVTSLLLINKSNLMKHHAFIWLTCLVLTDLVSLF